MLPSMEVVPCMVFLHESAGGADTFEPHHSNVYSMALELTDANFDQLVLDAGQPAVIDFWATWCPPCIAIGPTIEGLAASYEGRAVVGKLNVDENPAIAVRYVVMNLPCVLYILDGKVVDKQVGAAAAFVYEKKLRSVLERVGA